MSHASDLLCARLGEVAYRPGFLAGTPASLTADAVGGLGRGLDTLIWGDDGHGVGIVPFGFVSKSLQGDVIVTIRGTQIPAGSIVEWLDDFDAYLENCPFAPGAWHRGFGRVYQTLYVVKQAPVGRVRLAEYIIGLLGGTQQLVVHGHSLGGPLASYAALESHTPLPPVLFATPKWGDTLLTQTADTQWALMPASYANPNDAVPKVPITVTRPWRIEDFEQISSFIELDPNSVSPAIPADWASSHNLTNYRRLLEVLAP